MKKILYASLLSAMLFTMPGNAIEEVIELDLEEDTSSTMTLFGNVKEKEVFSFSNYVESIETTGASVDVITRQDIEKQYTPSISELLNQVGSLQIQNSKGSAGSISSIYMRGTDRVRLTIDGVRADRPSLNTAGAESQFILSDDIERIEVIKGPQGNLAGTNASGGLIAMQTRRGRGPLSFEMDSDFGNLGTFKERFAIMNGNESWDHYTGITWFKTDGGMRSSNLGRIHNDDYNNLSIVNNLGKRLLNQKAEVRNIFRFSRARKGVGYNAYGSTEDPNNYGLNYDIMNTTSFRHAPTEKYNYDAKFSVYHNENANYMLADDFSYGYEEIAKIHSTRLNAQTQHNYKLFDWNTLSLGYNLESEFIKGGTTFGTIGFPSSYDGYSGNTLQNDVYINDVINIKDMLFVRGGARLINHSDFGTYVTPNASASLILPTFKLKDAKTKFRGSWGQSVNNPTLYQRFGYLPYGMLISNPDLNAEKMNSWDVGIEQSFFDEKLSFDFGYFNSNYKDYIGYIDLDPDPWGYIGQYQNIDKARIQGYEGKITWTPKSWFKTILSYTYTDTEDKTTGHELVGTPKNSFKGNLYWTPNSIFSAFAGVVANSGLYSSMTETKKTNSYVDVNLGTKVRLWKNDNTEIFLNAVIYNLFDQDISRFRQGDIKYYAPGIHFRTGLSMKYTLPERKKKETL